MTCLLFSIQTLLLFTTFPSGIKGALTLIITGQTIENVNKHSLASLFVNSYDEIVKESTSHLLLFTNAMTIPLPTEENGLFSSWSNINLPTNMTTLVVTNIGIDQMSLNHLDILQKLISTNNALIVIEIGSPQIETSALLRCASCSMRGYASIASPNIVYFCNNASPNSLSSILRFEKLVYIEPFERKNACREPHPRPLWPNIFVSAAKSGDRTDDEYKHEHQHRQHHHPHHHHHHHHDRHRHMDEDVEEIVNMIMEEIKEQGGISAAEIPAVKQSKADKKKACKYRKSCYETGVKPVIHYSPISNIFLWWKEKSEDENDGTVVNITAYNVNGELRLQKLQCKYRYSCYSERGMPIQGKPDSGQEQEPIRSSKAAPVQGKKKSLKEIAAQALKESEDKASKRPMMKIVEKHLNEREEKLTEKLKCKYRKSCYETGERPYIEETWSLPLPITIFSTESVDSENNRINFDELEQLEKKLYCKYRKSCYETGVKPDIEPEISIENLGDLTTIHEQVETRKLSLQEKCKYRKSCYESGIVPDINPKLEAAINKEVSNVMPTNEQDLKLLCKYRKSCYAEVHDSATVDTIKLIRKRRQIEKEVRRRKARRIKHHRQLRGEMQLGYYRKLAVKRGWNESLDDQGDGLRPSKTLLPRKPRKQAQDKHEEGGDMKESPDSEGKRGKLKKLKQQQVKDAAQPITTKSKGTIPAKKERKSKKIKPEKQISEMTHIESSEKSNKTKFANEEENPEVLTPMKTTLDGGIHEDKVEEQQPIRDGYTDDVKKGKVLGKAVQTMNKLVEEMHHQQEQKQKKEFCKYRKSCYETGKKPEIKQSFHNLLKKFKEHVDREIVQDHISSKTEAEKKLDCKYRRSCYGGNQFSPTQSIITNEDHRRSIAGVGIERYMRSGKCNPYYYSCREILGLPPKERAPIGPNGRRLCRKKPL